MTTPGSVLIIRLMKALAKLERAPGLTLTRLKKPEVGHNDVMIRIRKTAICGTDLHIWNLSLIHI